VQHSLGLLEVSGLLSAIAVADMMAKTASVTLLGIERTRGAGWILVKIFGDVAAVQAALHAGEQMANADRRLVAFTTIARAAEATVNMVMTAHHPSGSQCHDASNRSDLKPDPAAAGMTTALAAVSEPALAAASEAESGPVLAPISEPEAASEPAVNAALETESEAALDVTSEPALEPAIISASVSTLDADAPPLGDATLPSGVDPTSSKASSAAVAAVTCTLCGDPQCPRHKGGPHVKCLHYQQPAVR